MSKVVRIAGAGGFLGDSQIAVPQVLAGGRVDYIILDYLAEATMSVLARAMAKSPTGGYARDFTDWVWKDNVASIRAAGVKIVTNAGGLNPAACRARMEEIAAEAGLSFRIAIVEGDDLRERLSEFREAREMFTGAPPPQEAATLSANAYLGAAPIAEALANGADMVITGRVVDSALVLGPLVHEFGWDWRDYDRLAAGSLAGHVLECGAQATGGLFTDWEDVPDWAHIGYPIAECRADGSFVLTKSPDTGGICTPATVAEQILYEIGDPQSYALPDVICDFTGVSVAAAGPDRVEVTGARGRPPSGLCKICLTYQDGWRTIAILPVLGRDAARKAERQAAAVLERVAELLKARNLPPFRATRVEALGTEVTYGAQARGRNTREVICKIALEHEDRRGLELFLREADSPITSMSVGSAGWFGSRPSIAPVARVYSFLLDQARLDPVVDLDGRRIRVGLADALPMVPPESIPAGESTNAKGDTRRVALIELAWARSGDKGDAFNVGVIARRREFLPYIRAKLTEQAVAAFFAHEFEGGKPPSVSRYEVPGLAALNLVLRESLGGGQMATLRLDALAKGKAQQLLDIELDVPASLLSDSAAATEGCSM